MSTRLAVLRAIAALIRAAVPTAEVLGVDDDQAAPATVPVGGRIVVDAGDPGDPEIVLSPVTYFYEHRVPLVVMANATADLSAEAAVDAMLAPIGTAIVANRTLGGLADWLDAVAPQTSDLVFADSASPRQADAVLLVTYATTNPLG